MALSRETTITWSLTNFATIAIMLAIIIVGWHFLSRIAGGFLRPAPKARHAPSAGTGANYGNDNSEMQDAA